MTSTEKVTFKGPVGPSMVSQELATEIKMILSNLRIAGYAISWKTAIVVGTAVLQSKHPKVLLEMEVYQIDNQMNSWNLEVYGMVKA